MPRNKRESLIFTVMMCFVMVFVMSVYNACQTHGWAWESVKQAWLGLPLAYAVAFICDWFLVAKTAKKTAFKIVKPTAKAIVKILAISICMVCGMVIFMSLFGAVNAVGFSVNALAMWPKCVLLSLMVALPLQVLVAGPVIRLVFGRLILQNA